MKSIVAISFVFLFSSAMASTIPAIPDEGATIQNKSVLPSYFSTIAKMKIKDIEKKIGRKLKLKEKIAIKIYQWKIKKGFTITKEDRKKDKGKTALILGIIGLAASLIPYIGGLVSLVCITLALILGYKAKKENPNDKNAKAAIILGWIAIGIFVVAAILIVAFLSGIGNWGWG